MNKKNILYLLSLLLLPIPVFAGSSSDEPIEMALLFEAFVSIHMSLFVLKPLSELISEDNSKEIFYILFIARIVILLYCDYFVTPMVFIIDFMSVFIGAFIVAIISMVKNRKTSIVYTMSFPTTTESQAELKCYKCGNIINENDKFCGECGAEITNEFINKATDAYVKYSEYPDYFKLTDDMFIEEVIKKKLTELDVENSKKLMPEEILKRKKVLNIISAILVYIYISLIFFHFPIITYFIGLVFLIIFYVSSNKYNIVKYLKKEVKSRPQEKITNIIMNVKTTLVPNNTTALRISTILLAIIFSLLTFLQPHIMYEKMDNGYGVRFYTFGLLNFTSAEIPESYKGEKVVSLRGNAFSNMFFLKKIKLPDTITEIRGQAFKNDFFLYEVNIPDNLEYLGGGSFYNCISIKNIILPDTLTYMGGEVFYHAFSLENIRLSNNLTEIRGNSFEECDSLKSITIPNNITRIGAHAFYGCSSLSEVNIDATQSKLQEIGSSAFRLCPNLLSINLPKSTYVNERAFKESPTLINYYDQNINRWDNNYGY